MLFAGTGHGFYYSMDDGTHWTKFSDGLPASPVSWVVVSKLYHDVVVSTYGRGIFVLKDISMLEQGDNAPSAEALRLYVPRTAVRDPRGGRAEFTFAVKDAPKDSVKVEIRDVNHGVIRTMKSIARPGLNRVTWDLRYDPPDRIDLRTLPPDNPHIWDEPRFRTPTDTTRSRVLTRGITHWGIDAPARSGPLATPGKYTVTVTTDAGSATQPVEVVRASNVTTIDSDLKASTAAQLRIRNAMNDAAAMANKLEIMRKQIEDLLAANASDASLVQPLRELDTKMMNVELRILSRSDLNTDDKWYVEPTKLFLSLIWLSGEVGTGAGDVAGGADHRPTDASMATLASLEKDLVATKAAYAGADGERRELQQDDVRETASDLGHACRSGSK